MRERTAETAAEPDMDEVRARYALWQLRRALEDAPGEIRYIRQIAMNGKPEPGEIVTEEMINLRSDAVQESDLMFAALADWCAYFAKQSAEPSPLPTGSVWLWPNGYARGFLPVTADRAAWLATIACSWLTARLERLIADVQFERFLADVTAAHDEMGAAFPPMRTEVLPPRPPHPRSCPHCAERTVMVSRTFRITDEKRYSGRYVLAVECETCGWRPDGDGLTAQVAQWLD